MQLESNSLIKKGLTSFFSGFSAGSVCGAYAGTIYKMMQVYAHASGDLSFSMAMMASIPAFRIAKNLNRLLQSEDISVIRHVSTVLCALGASYGTSVAADETSPLTMFITITGGLVITVTPAVYFYSRRNIQE